MVNNYLKTASLSTNFSEDSIKIKIATTSTEKREIYNFRYKIYVEEMCKNITEVNYTKKQLYDDLDDWTILLYAKIGSEIIGTIRINIGLCKDFPQRLASYLSLDAFNDCKNENAPFKIAYVTKLMVAIPYRNTPVLYQLIAKCYELCLNNQVQFAFGACNLYLLRLYEQIGFHRYSKNFTDPGYGLLAPIVLLINDIPHLRKVRSPLFRLARKRTEIDTSAVEWFHKEFTMHSRIINSKLASEDQLWSILCKRLACLPNEAINILRELSVMEAKKFLHGCGVLVQCNAGDLVTPQGDVSYSYNILISGKLKSLTFINPIKYYTLPGQHFGANGLTGHCNHTEDIAAIDTIEILVLSGMAFQRFSHSYPDIAHKIVQHIANLTKNKQLII